MKNLLFVLLSIAFCSLMLSCHKDDKAKPSEKIAGKWNGTKVQGLSYQDDKLVDSGTTYLTSPDYFKLEFKSGNAIAMDYSVQGDEGHVSGYYAIVGNTLKLGGTADDPDLETYTFNLGGNSLELISIDTYTENNHSYKDEERIFFQRQ